MHTSFSGCISKLDVYPTGFASKWRIVLEVAGLTGLWISTRHLTRAYVSYLSMLLIDNAALR